MRQADFIASLLISVLVWSTPVYADPPSRRGEGNPSETEVSLELLEFLGEFETEDGEWIDPDELDQMDSIDDNKPSSNNPENSHD